MKRILAALAVAASCATAHADVFVDPSGDTFTAAGGGILDILGVEVTNNATSISFKFTLAGDVEVTDWAKYMVAIDTVPGGDASGNGWSRPISMPSGMDYWLGAWVNSGNGAEVRAFSGAWSLTEATYNPAPDNDVTVSKFTNTVTITTLLSNLGLGHGSVVLFDAFTSGGGDSDGAVDSLGNPLQQIGDWSQPSDAHPVAYTIFIPTPGAVGLLAAGGLLAMRRRR
ncbi:MAG: hypothetical protein IT438_13155 [Phycisphaerales bacterium]|nr:hypothetical protein [Phycisphaerales bacterium]